MKATLRITRVLLADIQRDLERPHDFASERVGFVFCRFGSTGAAGLVVLAHEYMPVADDHYIDDARFGALIGPDPPWLADVRSMDVGRSFL